MVGMAAKDNHAFAREFVAPLLAELIDGRGLDAIRYFNPVNEPMEYGIYQTPGDQPPAILHYVDMYRELRAALDGRGLSRDRLGLVGMDTIEPLRQLLRMHALGADIDPYIDAYSVHHYNLRLDHQPPRVTPDNTPDYFDVGIAGVVEREDREVLRYCRQRGKPLWALEMGSFYNGKFHQPEGVANFETTLIVAEAILRAANMGISTFCIWSLMNTDSVDGFWSVLRLRDGKWEPGGYPFAVYRALGQHLRPGARLIPVDPEVALRPRHVYGSWALGPGSCASLMLVNDHPEEMRRVQVVLPEGCIVTRDFRWLCLRDGEPSPDLIGWNWDGESQILELPPFSMTLFVANSAASGSPVR